MMETLDNGQCGSLTLWGLGMQETGKLHLGILEVVKDGAVILHQ